MKSLLGIDIPGSGQPVPGELPIPAAAAAPTVHQGEIPRTSVRGKAVIKRTAGARTMNLPKATREQLAKLRDVPSTLQFMQERQRTKQRARDAKGYVRDRRNRETNPPSTPDSGESNPNRTEE